MGRNIITHWLYFSLRELCKPWHFNNKVQSTLVISKSKGLSETLQDTCISTYRICDTEEINKSNNHILQNEYVIWLLKLDIYSKYCGKEEKLLFSTIFCYLLFDFHIKTGIRFSLRDKLLFEISECMGQCHDKRCENFHKNCLWKLLKIR